MCGCERGRCCRRGERGASECSRCNLIYNIVEFNTFSSITVRKPPSNRPKWHASRRCIAWQRFTMRTARFTAICESRSRVVRRCSCSTPVASWQIRSASMVECHRGASACCELSRWRIVHQKSVNQYVEQFQFNSLHAVEAGQSVEGQQTVFASEQSAAIAETAAGHAGANRRESLAIHNHKRITFEHIIFAQINFITSRASPGGFNDPEELLPMCYKCSNYCAHLRGNKCPTCLEEFVFSFVSFGERSRTSSPCE